MTAVDGCMTRRRWLGWAGVAGAALGAAACGATGGGSSTGVTPGANELKGKITFYARANMVENQGQEQIFLPTFKQVAPSATVEHNIFAATTPDETYGTKLYAMFAAGDGPDLWGFGGNYWTYWARGLAADLNPLIARDKYDLGQFHKGLADMFRVKGKQYGLPQLTTFGSLLFYNKNLLQEVGITKLPTVDWEDKTWTMDQAGDIARKTTKNAGEASAVYGINFDLWAPHAPAWLFGGDAFLPEHYKEGIAPATKLDSKESIDALQFMQDLRWKQRYAMRSGDPSVSQPGKGTFTSGRLALHLSGGWNFWNYGGVQTDFQWAAAALPIQASNKNPNYNDFWIMAKASKNPDLAWAFMKHITSADVQTRFSDLNGTPPTNRGAIESWYRKWERVMPRADLEKLTQGAIDHKRSVESPDHTFLDFGRMDQLFNREVRDPILRNEGTPRELVTKAKPVLDALVKEIHDQWKGKLPT